MTMTTTTLDDLDVSIQSRRVADTLATFEARRGELRGPDGRSPYSEEELARREAALLATFDQAVEPIRQRAQATLEATDRAEEAAQAQAHRTQERLMAAMLATGRYGGF